MKGVILSVLFLLSGAVAHAGERSGNVSFGGISVRVVVDPERELFQVGESKFRSPVHMTPQGRVMEGSDRVGINLEYETLIAMIFLDGGDGGNIEGYQEYPCSDVRVTILRFKSNGDRIVVKNECTFLR